MDRDSAISSLTFKMPTENYLSFSAFYLLQVHLHFSKKKILKKSQNSRNQSFPHYFCLMIKNPDPYLWLTDPDPTLPVSICLAKITFLTKFLMHNNNHKCARMTVSTVAGSHIF